MPARKNTMSKIIFRPTAKDNQVVYACEASHPALLEEKVRRSEVLVSVLCKLLLFLFFPLNIYIYVKIHQSTLKSVVTWKGKLFRWVEL